jgi:hypothetical protein
MGSDEKTKEGAWMAVIAAIISGVGTALVFLLGFDAVRDALLASENAEGHRMFVFVFPALTDIGIGAAILWAVAAWGFFKHKIWSHQVALTGCVLCLLTGFIPMLPMAGHGIFPLSPFFVFLPNVIFFFLLTRRIRCVPGWVVALAFLGALGILWSFINGMASTHRMFQGSGVIYIFSERLHFFIAAAWAVFSLALVARKCWAPDMGIAVACTAIIFGTPLTIVDIISLGRFSFFGVSPIFGLLMLILMLLRPPRRAMKQWSSDNSSGESS